MCTSCEPAVNARRAGGAMFTAMILYSSLYSKIKSTVGFDTKVWAFVFRAAAGEAGAEPGADDALGRRRPHGDHVQRHAAALRRWRVLGHGA